MPFFSIIIPVYNIYPYLSRCVSSLLSQSFTDVEILLIDDGSTDGSERLCDELCERLSCVKVLHQPNAGVSSARNVGLANATGRYVWFVDGDDYVVPNALRSISHVIESHKQPSAIIFEHVTLPTSEPYHQRVLSDDRVGRSFDCQNIDDLCHLLREGELGLYSICFRRNCLGGLFFPAFAYGEDLYFEQAFLTQRASIVVKTTMVCYVYSVRSDSATTKPCTYLNLRDRIESSFARYQIPVRCRVKLESILFSRLKRCLLGPLVLNFASLPSEDKQLAFAYFIESIAKFLRETPCRGWLRSKLRVIIWLRSVFVFWGLLVFPARMKSVVFRLMNRVNAARA